MSFFAEQDGSVRGFICRTDWECEIGGVGSGSKVYPSVADLKRHRECYAECGIVEVRVSLMRVVEEGDG